MSGTRSPSQQADRPNGSSDLPAAANAAPGWWRQKLIVEERYVGRLDRRRIYRMSIALAIVGLAIFTVMLVGVLTHAGFERLDRPVEQWFDAHRNGGSTAFMVTLAIVFGPVAMPIIVAVVTISWAIFAKHAWRPMLLACGMVTGVATAEILAPIVRHPRPPIGLMLLGPDHTFSFPSGHVLGASDFLLITAYLIASRHRNKLLAVVLFVVAALGIALQVVSRLYLGYHWITDTLASVGLSMTILAIVIAVDTRRTVRVPGERIEGAHSQLQQDGT